jgi:hypothetical protein
MFVALMENKKREGKVEEERGGEEEIVRKTF